MKKRIHIIDKKNNLFIKTYKPEELQDEDIIRMEYKKGIILSAIINYPKPLKIDNNSIYYELLDIKYSLFDLLVNGAKIDLNIFKEIGSVLRKMHDYNVIHGDFSPINIVFTKNNEIYFIDASFSCNNTKGKVLFEVYNIYHDISIFLMHLKVSKPLYKPWLFFLVKRDRNIKEYFLKGYFGNVDNFDEEECLNMENCFMHDHIKKMNKLIPHKLIKILIMRFFIFLNKLEINKKYSKEHKISSS